MGLLLFLRLFSNWESVLYIDLGARERELEALSGMIF